MLGGVEPMQVINQCNLTVQRDNNTLDVKVDIPEENENEVGAEETEEQVYVVENPSLDLEVVLVFIEVFLHLIIFLIQATANAYTGLAKLYRLQFIAEHCPCYRVEALKLAIG